MDRDMLQDVLKTARNKLGLKQNEVAAMVGVTTQTYLKWENGKSEPKISQAGKLAKALKVSEKELCQGDFHKQKMEPIEFIRRVETLLKHTPHTEFLIGIQEYIHDEEGFLNKLKEASEFPYEIFDEQEKSKARQMLEMLDVLMNPSEEKDKVEKQLKEIINK
ncbi:helix-turn-helix transcriptional regulator [Vibrio parahaemolyticus]|uniref:helix-turn-helix transcriptional regulator n=1 Tax=Vibrio parahaemolyticus TaxID=670 RepID=UPI001F558EC6|nr:transcriptional regulator [Vibrio parahaemolyticus]